MMAVASDVVAAVALVNGLSPPVRLLTFNEPEYSYGGFTPTMISQQASDAIQPLLKSQAKAPSSSHPPLQTLEANACESSTPRADANRSSQPTTSTSTNPQCNK